MEQTYAMIDFYTYPGPTSDEVAFEPKRKETHKTAETLPHGSPRACLLLTLLVDLSCVLERRR